MPFSSAPLSPRPASLSFPLAGLLPSALALVTCLQYGRTIAYLFIIPKIYDKSEGHMLKKAGEHVSSCGLEKYSYALNIEIFGFSENTSTIF